MKLQLGRIDLPLAIVSLILGVCVWVWAKSTQDQKSEVTISAPVEVINTPKDLVASSYPRTWDVKLTGDPTDMSKIKGKSVGELATIDLSNARSGIGTYPIRVSIDKQFANIETSYEKSVDVILEELAHIPHEVEVEEFREAPSGLRYAASVVTPNQVILKGTRRDLDQVGRAKVLLDLSKVSSGTAVPLEVQVLDKDGAPIERTKVQCEPPAVSVTPSFSATEPQRTVLISPTWRGNPAPGFRVAAIEVRPNQATVRGERKLLANLTVVETEQVSLEGLQSDTTIGVALRLPKGVRLVSDRRLSVRVRIVALPGGVGPPPTGG